MGSVGNSSNEYYQGTQANIFAGYCEDATSILGPRSKQDVEERMDALLSRYEGSDYVINPNYNDESFDYKDYHHNCALCTFSTALYLMGYDVEAMPRDKDKWRGSSTLFDVNKTYEDNIYGSHNFIGKPTRGQMFVDGKWHDVDKMPRGAKKAAEAIYDKVKSWGAGSFGEIHVSWKDSTSSHSMVLLNHRGTPIIYDSQTNEVYSDKHSFEKLLNSTNASGTTINRLDTVRPRKRFSDDIEEHLLMMTKRKNK